MIMMVMTMVMMMMVTMMMIMLMMTAAMVMVMIPKPIITIASTLPPMARCCVFADFLIGAARQRHQVAPGRCCLRRLHSLLLRPRPR